MALYAVAGIDALPTHGQEAAAPGRYLEEPQDPWHLTGVHVKNSCSWVRGGGSPLPAAIESGKEHGALAARRFEAAPTQP